MRAWVQAAASGTRRNRASTPPRSGARWWTTRSWNPPIAAIGKASYSNGSQALTLPGGSTLSPHPPTEDSLHGKQSDKNTIDEFWAFDRIQAKALRGAIVPTTTTRRKLVGHRPQLWILSTEGTQESEALNDLLAELRANVPHRVAFFDFGIPHDTALPDEEDRAAVSRFLDLCWEHHPGAGHLFEREDMDGFLTELGLSEFTRAYGNRRTGAVSRIIPEGDWNAAGTADVAPDDAAACFGASVGKDDTDAAITVTWLLPDGRKLTEVIRHGMGSGWVLDALAKLQEVWGIPAVIDAAGPSAELYDRASKRDDIELLDITMRQYTGACSSVYRGVVNRAEDGAKLPPVWLHRPHQALNDAADVAAKRSTGDAAWAWGRRVSSGSVAVLEAATLSTWGVDNLPEATGLQVF
ncbi:hypothetical protein [Arthrobacter woluwensis]|uniref:hypothetical protein n=1 Tax=Arthrobacter woluwensis TaxID=156980 RepID=UPI001AAEC3D8|nr:hypothetical protein [Arthrobacter woluwensis]QTF71758.1 hypothetical protein G8758_06895 [Arthrobacter woluwensis]